MLVKSQKKETPVQNFEIYSEEEEEVLAEDILSYISKYESERTMYDGSCEGFSKVDFSVVDSTIARMGHSEEHCIGRCSL